MSVNEYFESIKRNKAKLRQFLADMPKGADLHNHLTGAVYSETMFSIAYEKKFWVNLETGKLSATKPVSDPDEPETENYIQLVDDTFNPQNKDHKDFHVTRMTLIDKWSIRDFQPYKYPLGPDEYFFSLFGTFGPAAVLEYLPDFVHELKVRAKTENLQYIEVMGIPPTVPKNGFISQKNENKLKVLKKSIQNLDKLSRNYNSNPQKIGLDLYTLIRMIVGHYEDLYKDEKSVLHKTVEKYVLDNYDILNENTPQNEFLTSRFDTTAVLENEVMMKLQGYASRNSDPLVVLAQLYIVHKAMQVQKDVLKQKRNIENAPDVIVGCNIVAAENSEKSMQFYRTHMIMFSVLKDWFKKGEKDQAIYPNTSLHAGELTMGLIRPEHLTYHVTDAVKIAGAKRIGHGVDIVFEHNSAELLEEMKKKNIAVEINLTSNEFILGVRDDAHPFRLYKDSGVPVVISTDDPGILRTSITEEFTHAVYRYGLTYAELKEIVSNSITYSFLNDEDKENVRKMYNAKLSVFEAKYKNYVKP